MKFKRCSLLFLVFAFYGYAQPNRDSKPNIIIIFVDDMGYGDLGVYGHPTIRTPNLDQMAYEGQKWTNFYAAAPVCTPSRAGLLTGRLPVRMGMASEIQRTLRSHAKGGLPTSEITIAKKLKGAGYRTAAIGKWHLGDRPEYLPNAHGFDYYFGIPYSNDMDRANRLPYVELLRDRQMEDFNVPLLRNLEELERPANQRVITKRYTEEAVDFIHAHKEEPFFLYLAHSMPHVPLFSSADFEGKSLAGLYGDVVSELDWSVGEVLGALKESGIDENTLVVFTSDNGPWLMFGDHGGSAGVLRGGKGGTFEGGMRVPAIFRWPDNVKPGVIQDLGSTLDLFPTIVALTGQQLPNDRIFDGYDLSNVLLRQAESPRNEIFYYRDTEIYAVRRGQRKVHFITQDDYGNRDKVIHRPPVVYDLGVDPAEKYNIANKGQAAFIQEMRELLERHERTIVPVINQLER